MAACQPCFPPEQIRAEDCYLRFGLAADGGATPRLEEALRFVSIALHSPPNGWKLRAGRFSEGIFEANSEDVYLCGSTAFLSELRAALTRSLTSRLQISHDDSRNYTNITTQFADRQPLAYERHCPKHKLPLDWKILIQRAHLPDES